MTDADDTPRRCSKGKCQADAEPLRAYCAFHREQACRHAAAVRARAKARGVCVRCRRVAPAPGAVTCQECLAKHATPADPLAGRLKRLRRWAEGACPVCGGPRSDGVHATCSRCRARQAAYGANAYADRKARGVCVTCGERPAGVSTTGKPLSRCDECRAKYRARELARAARK